MVYIYYKSIKAFKFDKLQLILKNAQITKFLQLIIKLIYLKNSTSHENLQ